MRAATTRVAPNDATALVLFDHVELLFDELVDHIQCVAAALGANRAATPTIRMPSGC
jgi:hypothetical protein